MLPEGQRCHRTAAAPLRTPRAYVTRRPKTLSSWIPFKRHMETCPPARSPSQFKGSAVYFEESALDCGPAAPARPRAHSGRRVSAPRSFRRCLDWSGRRVLTPRERGLKARPAPVLPRRGPCPLRNRSCKSTRCCQLAPEPSSGLVLHGRGRPRSATGLPPSARTLPCPPPGPAASGGSGPMALAEGKRPQGWPCCPGRSPRRGALETPERGQSWTALCGRDRGPAGARGSCVLLPGGGGGGGGRGRRPQA